MKRTTIIQAGIFLALAWAAAFSAQATTTAALSGSQLQISFNDPTDSALVTTSAGNVEVHDVTNSLTIFSQPIASIQSIRAIGNFNGQLVLDGVLTLSSGVFVQNIQTLIHTGDYNVGGGAYFAGIDHQLEIALQPGAVSTIARIQGSSPITLFGNNVGSFAADGSSNPGVLVHGGTVIATGSATINIQGYGNNGTGASGVLIDGGSSIQVQGSGSMSVSGVSRASSQGVGIEIAGVSTLSAASNAISMNGVGSQTASAVAGNNHGVYIHQGSQLSSNPPGAIIITGTAGGTGLADSNDGVRIGGVGGAIPSKLNAGSGGLTIFATRGSGPSSFDLNLTPDNADLIGFDVELFVDNVSICSANTCNIVGTNDVSFTTGAGTQVDLGGTNAPGKLALDATALSRVFLFGSAVLVFNAGTPGATISAPIAGGGSWQRLFIKTAGPFSGPGAVTVGSLELQDSSTFTHNWTIDGSGNISQDFGTPIMYVNSGASPTGSLQIDGGSGADTFAVTPIAGVNTFIDGGNPTTFPGDTLNVPTAGASGPMGFTRTGSSFSGGQNFGGGTSVNFNNIEAGNMTPTQMVVTGPSVATIGVPISVTLTALDAAGNIATMYTGPIHFSSTSLGSLPGDTFISNGTATFNNVVLVSPGTQTVTVNDFLSPSFQGTTGPITVVGPAASFVMSAPATAASGSPVSFTVTAMDGFGQVALTYTGTVHFTSSDPLAILPADVTLTNGVGTFSATLRSVGTEGIVATDTVNNTITGNANVNVLPGAATHFDVSAPATGFAGSGFFFTVTALDASNNVATGYTGTVHFTSTDGSAILPADFTLTNGVGAFNATLRTAGSQTLTATDTVSGSVTGTSGTIALAAGAPTHLSVAAPASATSGASFSFTVTALDAFNNLATSYVGTVHFTSTDGAATLPADFTVVGGAGTFSATLATTGSRTITATDTVSSSITGTSGSITVGAGAVTHFSVTAAATGVPTVPLSFTVTALDASNNIVTSYAGTIHFTSSDATAVLPADLAIAAGTGTFNATFNAVGSKTITATDTVSAAITGTSGSILVAAQTYSGPSATGTGTITASFIGGGAGCTFSGPQFIGAPPGSPPVPPTLPSEGARFPQGMFDFSLTGCTPGSTITMTIVYPQSIDGAKYLKYGPEAANPVAHWYVRPATISGNTVTVPLTDGGQGDDDLTANGTIDDQGGPAFGPASGIPMLSEWMLGLLALLLLATCGRFVSVPSRRCE